MLKVIKRREDSSEKSHLGEDIHPLLKRIYSARDVIDDGQLERELKGLTSPKLLKGVDDASALLADVLASQGRILVVGDFDADGATSSALAVSALEALGAQHVDFLVPNRFEYGYGLTPEIVEVATQYNPDLIVTVDNGISSISGVDAAQAHGIKVLVTDHHLAGNELPKAEVIVNPNQPGCEFPSKNLAGVGVIFYVMSALRSHLRTLDWFEQNNIPEPNMATFLDLVALGTVADVVPLDHNNRILVHQGLRRIRAGATRPGILALLEVSGRQKARLVAADMGFAVGPRLNAAGRLDDMSLGINCLLTDDPLMAKEIAVQLDELNQDRKNIEQSMQREALQSLESLSLSEEQLPFGICLYDPEWHQGVIGILASRIKDRYSRPVIAFADAGTDEIKGSARSIQGLHIRDVLDAIAARHPGLLVKFGGHAMAAGMSIQKTDYEEFSRAFDDEVRRQLCEEDFRVDILSDGELAVKELNLDIAELIRDAGPWGQAFPEPIFDGDFIIVQQRIVGERHLKLMLAPLNNKQFTLDAIHFNADLDQWPSKDVDVVNVAYRLDINEFRGQRTVQLMVEHLNPVVVKQTEKEAELVD